MNSAVRKCSFLFHRNFFIPRRLSFSLLASDARKDNSPKLNYRCDKSLFKPCSSLVRTNFHSFIPIQINVFRLKHSKKGPSKAQEEESDEEEDEEEDLDSVESKTVTVKISTLRLDDLLLSTLYFRKSKTDALVKDGRIRVNGEKIYKKAIEVHVGDTIDAIKGFDPENREKLKISQVKVNSIAGGAHNNSVTCTLNRSLTIENYPGNNSF